MGDEPRPTGEACEAWPYVDTPLARAVLAADWSATSLGPIERWSAALRGAAAQVLASSLPQCIWWGPDLVRIHNDRFEELFGDAFREFLGQPAATVWDSAPEVLAVARRVLRTGRGEELEGLTLPRREHDPAEFDCFLTPLREADGTMAGVLLGAFETRRHRQAARESQAAMERERAVVAATDALRRAPDLPSMQAALAEAVVEHLHADRAAVSVLDPSTDQLLKVTWVRGDGSALPAMAIPLEDVAPLQDAFSLGTAVIDDLDARIAADGAGSADAWELFREAGARACVLIAFRRGGQVLGGVGIASLTPRRWSDEEVSLLEDIAERTEDAIGRAIAVASLRASEARQAFLLRLNDVLRPLVDPGEVEQTVVDLLGEHLGADRVHYLAIDEVGATWTIAREFVRPGLRSAVGVYPVDRLPPVPAEGGTRVVADFTTDERFSPAARKVAEALGARSALIVHVVKDGRSVALFQVGCRTPRVWTREEVSLVEQVADRAWSAAERGRAEQAQRATVAQLGAVVDALVEGVVLLDAAGRTVFSNDAARRLHGHLRRHEADLDLLRSSCIRPDGSPLPRDEEPITAVLRDGRSVRGMELGIPDREGRTWWRLVNAEPVRDTHGAIAGVVVSFFDITDRKIAAEQRALAQRLEAVGQLAGGIAHDFNNLLTIVAGHLDLIAEATTDDAIAPSLQAAQVAVEAGAALNRRLLAFAREQPVEPRIVDLNVRAGDVVTLLRRTLGDDVTVEAALDAATADVQMDPGAIDNVIVNLAVNARDALPNGGTITVRTSVLDVDEETASTVADATPGRFVRLSVVDDGVGMTPEVRERAIEPYFSTKGIGRGTGLGLSSVYGVTTQAGGFLVIESEPGGGTAVHVHLPAAVQAAAASSTDVRGEEQRGGRGEVVLVVEDNDDLRFVTRRQLEALGYTVREASTGPEAVDVLQAVEDVDVVFSDIVMPGGMNGYQLAEWVRGHRPDVPVRLTTGYADHRGPDDPADDLDPAGVLAKPYTRLDLARVVADALADAG